MKAEGEVVELEIKGDCCDSGREGYYIRTMNLCRKAVKGKNGIDSKEILHTPCKHMYILAHIKQKFGVDC